MISSLVARPERSLLALILMQIAFWTLAPALSHSAPPLDVVEMYAWGREGVIATFKHPNLPGLILEPTRLLTGEAGWPAYLVSQLFIALTFWATYRLGCELMDKPSALAGTLLLTGVYFFSWPTPEFNHNVAQMPLWALATLALWQATTHGRWLAWLALGACAGLGLWAKYSFAVLLVIAAIWILWDELGRRRLLTPGPWLALAAFALIAAQQALWLVDNDFAPFGYAARRASHAEWYAPLEFLATLAVDHLPMIAILAAAGLFGRAIAGAPPKPEARAMRFLLLLGLGPAALMAIGAALTGASLRASWGAPMLSLSGLLVIAILHDRLNVDRLKRIAIGAGVLIILISGLYFAHMRYGFAFSGKPLRGNWPQHEISTQMEGVWRAETNGAPLRIVAGDIWTAGLITMDGPNPPSVLINGDLSISPWVTADELRRNGALLVWSERRPAPLTRLLGETPEREWTFYAPNSGPMTEGIVIRFAILPPQTPPP
jgi:4-amino-4-deoxy-L-arabinose transferase-like glycosyltransferase